MRLFRPRDRAHFQALTNLGLTDAYRACHDEPHRFTFWDYQAGAWQKNHGLRIDHHAAFRRRPPTAWSNARSTRAPRGWEKPSDHVPVWLELSV